MPALVTESGEMYGGRVKYDYYDSSHRYKVAVDGKPAKYARGVTTLIGEIAPKPALVNWAKKQSFLNLFGIAFSKNYPEGVYLKGQGVIWDNKQLLTPRRSKALKPILKEAYDASAKRATKAADIGTLGTSGLPRHRLYRARNRDRQLV